MYSIQKTSFGYCLVLEGILDDAEVAQLRDEMRTGLSEVTESYSVIVDLRKLVPPRKSVLAVLGENFDLAFKTGIHRIAVIYSSPVIRDMIKQLAFLSGRNPSGRYIDASRTENPDQLARDYVDNGVEPPATTTQKIHIVAD